MGFAGNIAFSDLKIHITYKKYSIAIYKYYIAHTNAFVSFTLSSLMCRISVIGANLDLSRACLAITTRQFLSVEEVSVPGIAY